MPGPIRLLTFDLDNTLWPVDEVIIAANALMREWLDAQTPGFNEAFSDTQMLNLRQALIARRPNLRHDLSAMRIAILNSALTQFGHDNRNAKRIAEGAFKIFLDARHQVRYYPDVEDTLAQLASRYTLAALSNGNADVSRLAVNQHFSFSYSAASVGASKPHPAMFEAALTQANLNARSAIHIGDHLVDDIQGAHAVGMQTIWLDQGGDAAHAEPEDSVTPGRRVTTVADICAAVAALDVD
ncbi:MAG: HAD family hydrolase [Pseudomonadales bacterium]